MAATAGTIALEDDCYGDERTRLVRLCGQITGQPGIAEDLAQETLAEAWRLRERLTDPTGYDRWLSAIARNICRRWMRAQGREQMRLVELAIDPEELAGDWDLSVELEREELALLLDRALSLLPPETRASLIGRHIEELPHTEIAERLRISEGAVAMRLLRGRVALCRLLTTELRTEAETYGLVRDSCWQQTSIWCPVCGQHRLSGRSMDGSGEFRLRCFGCFPAGNDDSVLNIAHTRSAEVLGDAIGWKASLSKVMASFDDHFSRAVAERAVPCPQCGHRMLLRQGLVTGVPGNAPVAVGRSGVHLRCESCGDTADIHLLGRVLYSPTGRRFWQNHPRLRMLPEQSVEAQGRDAVVARLESLTDRASLNAVVARDTFELLAIHTTPSA